MTFFMGKTLAFSDLIFSIYHQWMTSKGWDTWSSHRDIHLDAPWNEAGVQKQIPEQAGELSRPWFPIFSWLSRALIIIQNSRFSLRAWKCHLHLKLHFTACKRAEMVLTDLGFVTSVKKKMLRCPKLNYSRPEGGKKRQRVNLNVHWNCDSTSRWLFQPLERRADHQTPPHPAYAWTSRLLSTTNPVASSTSSLCTYPRASSAPPLPPLIYSQCKFFRNVHLSSPNSLYKSLLSPGWQTCCLLHLAMLPVV